MDVSKWEDFERFVTDIVTNHQDFPGFVEVLAQALKVLPQYNVRHIFSYRK